mgnify:CR=1 FL=1
MGSNDLHFKVSCPKCGKEGILSTDTQFRGDPPLYLYAFGFTGDGTSEGRPYVLASISCSDECGFYEEFRC